MPKFPIKAMDDIKAAAMDKAPKFDKSKIKEEMAKTTAGLAEKAVAAKDTAMAAKDKAGKLVDQSMSSAVMAIDQNGDGKIDIEDVIILAMKTPGVKVDRDEFLRKELFKNHPTEVINTALEYNPMRAGISRDEVDKMADEVIKYERNCVSGISTVLGMPGGAAALATVPADVAQYYGYLLRATQKLLYLYGFPQIDVKEGKNHPLDSETMNILILCMGVMYGVANAGKAINVLAKSLATGVEKKLVNMALTKGTIYPIVKSTAKWFGVNMTKSMFAGAFKKAIPVVGGVISGGISFVSFKPCCDKLKESLRDTMLSNPEYKGSKAEDEYIESIVAGEEVELDEFENEESSREDD